MHGCNHSIGCLSVSAFRVGDGIDASASRVGDGLELSAFRIGKGLNVSCNIVCSLNKDAYLRVEPDVIWLTPDMIGGEFDIYSNVVWRID